MKEHLTFKHRYFADFDTEEKWIEINNYGIKKIRFPESTSATYISHFNQIQI